jgi:hypothetical protein
MPADVLFMFYSKFACESTLTQDRWIAFDSKFREASGVRNIVSTCSNDGGAVP